MITESTLHAGCVVVGEAGILIRGASGAGKSRLALALVDAASLRGLYARLVADDRVRITRHGTRLVARPHPALAGLVEVRGLGLLPMPHAPAAVVRLVVDLLAEPPERLPDPQALEAEILGVALPRLPARTPSEIVTIALARAAGFSVTPIAETRDDSGLCPCVRLRSAQDSGSAQPSDGCRST